MIPLSPALPSLLGIFGLLVGSYLGTIVIRWPEGKSATTGRSACDGCGERLRWFELIPLFSAMMGRMHCRRCGACIDPAHSAAELLAALIPFGVALMLPAPAALAYAVMVWLLIPLALLDWRHFWLPDRLTGLLALIGLFGGHWLGMAEFVDRLIGGAVGFALLWIVMRGYRALRGVEGLGAGDPKLLGALGFWMGWAALPMLLLAGAGLGLVHALRLGISGRARREMPMPFGTYLAIGAAFVPPFVLMAVR